KELGGLPSADDPAAIAEWRARMLERLRADRGAGGVDLEFTSAGRGRGAELLREASAKYPDAWVKKSNAVGKVSARFNRSRGWHRSAPADAFGNFNSTIKLGYKKTAIHELGHRMQAVMPGLDNFFSQLHARRTAGEPLERLSHLKPRGRFDWNEVARPDKYADAYFGKEYSGTPLELLTMSYQGLLHGGLQDGDQDLIERMLTKDPEMLNLALGLLFNYEP
ncbi:MAG: hypothetical protein ACREQD_12995, partial [Candidatus Binataceae bacterium]